MDTYITILVNIVVVATLFFAYKIGFKKGQAKQAVKHISNMEDMFKKKLKEDIEAKIKENQELTINATEQKQ